ncbi:hypothetical protein, partial [Sabulibacter ruber]|uniref:hypothetical protein n=1 Tax=Sabulibacter ruber TaxID=2811901 RepID=UPI001A95E4BD
RMQPQLSFATIIGADTDRTRSKPSLFEFLLKHDHSGKQGLSLIPALLPLIRRPRRLKML